VNGRASHAAHERDLSALVEQLCQGRAEAMVAIAQAGGSALPQLMKRFPGPITNAEGARASDAGPLLAALAKIGTPSLGYVVRASESEDDEVRRWAALLLGEMPSADASKAVVQRLADDTPEVAQAAFSAARQLLGGPAANQFRRALFEIADEKRAPLKLRLRSIEHSAKLKDGPSVPRLISLLNTGVEPIIVKSQWALTMITRHDMGRDIQAWSDWWHAHRAQHRIQWLIEALDHDDLRLRRAAFEELSSEVGEDFGYRAELEQSDRIAAQTRYRDWWSSTGARRYGRLY
jgi:HEAT repeat protein